MTAWIAAALPYVKLWLDYQEMADHAPGFSVAISRDGQELARWAFGKADIASGELLTPDHRFRIASHSKTFATAAILKLRELGRLHLDDPVGRHVAGLPPEVAGLTLEQLLSHGSGLHRDGRKAAHWINEADYPDADGLTELYRDAATLASDQRFKYSNVGFALIGQVIAAITGETFNDWVAREIVAPSGLAATVPDMPLPDGGKLATGHGLAVPHGRKAIRADMSTNAMAAATGFVSTASDIARFIGSLAPDARHSVLSATSRRDMIRARWMTPDLGEGRGYGLGVILSRAGKRAAFGHAGGFQGFITRTIAVPDWNLAVSVLTNAIDGPATQLAEGMLGIFAKFEELGAPTDRVADWSGRWWSMWGAEDLVPMGDKVLVADPSAFEPFALASEIEIADRLSGRVAKGPPYGSHGEPVVRKLDAEGRQSELFFGGSILRPTPPA